MSRHGEIMHLATLAAEIRASDTAEFYAGRRVSERNYKEALAALSAAVAEQARRAACFDELVAALEDALEFIEDQEDVVDGDEGQQQPNHAMTLAQDLRAALANAKGKP